MSYKSGYLPSLLVGSLDLITVQKQRCHLMFTTHIIMWTLRNNMSFYISAKPFPTPYQNQREKFSPLKKVTQTDLPKGATTEGACSSGRS